MCVTVRPRASMSAPIEAALSPLPIDETTPPVTRTNLVLRLGAFDSVFGFVTIIPHGYRAAPARYSPPHFSTVDNVEAFVGQRSRFDKSF